MVDSTITTPAPEDTHWRGQTPSMSNEEAPHTLIENIEKMHDSKEPERHGTILSGFSVITKSMIGSGIFSMAHACSKFGVIPAVLLLLLAASITWLSLKVLAKLALEYRTDSPTFYSVSERILPRFKWVVDVALIINCLGAAIVYVQTAGNLMSFAIISAMHSGNSPGGLDQRMIAMIVQAIMITALAPLCMMKEISATKVANLIGLSCLLYIVICTFFYTPATAHTEGGNNLMYPSNMLTALGSFPTFIFAFACQQNEFTVANELKNATKKRLDIVNISATMTGLLVYMPMMILPFLTFGREVKSNYLYNLDAEDGVVDIPIIIAFIFASISVSISYVLQVQPIRRSVESLLYGTTNKPVGRKEVMSRVSIATIILLASFGLAVGLGDDLSLPINVAGLLGGNTMCFVMPFFLYLTRYGIDRKSPLCIAIISTLVFCLALYPICLTGIIYDAVVKSAAN